MKLYYVSFFCISLIMSNAVNAGIIDFTSGIYSPNFTMLTSWQATIETEEYGIFTDEWDIEHFFNNSNYSFTGYKGDEISFTLNNSNSIWSLSSGGSIGGTLEVISNKNSLSLNFSTQNEFSDVAIMLRNFDTWDVMQIRQSNNISNQNFIQFEDGNLSESVWAIQQYDTSYFFTSVKVPEPSTFAILALGMMVLASRKFKK
jgi:hypothetical protein